MNMPKRKNPTSFATIRAMVRDVEDLVDGEKWSLDRQAAEAWGSDRVRLHSGNFLQLTTEQFARTTSHSIDYIWTLFSPPQLSGFVKQVGFDGGIPDGTVGVRV